MATIELYKSKINNMSNILGNVKAEVNSYALGLALLSSQLLSVDNPALDKAVSALSTASKVQEQQISGLNARQKIIDIFVFNVQVIDSRVAGCIRDLQKMYDAVYNYRHSDKSGIKTDTLAEYLYKTWGDRFTQGYNAYNSKDLKNMSQEEIEEYVNQLLSIDDSNLTEEDKTKIKAVLDFFPDVNVTNNMSETDKKKIRQYVNLYEKVYPKDKQAIDSFFDASNKDGITEDDIINIKYIAYKSKSPCHEVFFDNISECKVVSWNYNGTSHYDFKDKSRGVYLNLSSGDGIDNPRGAYNTFFHEIGHNIDDLLVDGYDYDANASYVGIYTTDEVASGRFYDVIYKDVEQNFKNAISSYSNDEALIGIDSTGQAKILDVLMGRANRNSLNPRLDFAYRKIYEDYTGIWKGAFSGNKYWGSETGSLQGAQREQVSDITGGITNNATKGDYGHTGDGYWYKGKNSEDIVGVGTATDLQQMEFFAEYFAYEMTGDPDEAYARNYFPNSYRIMDEAMRKKANEINAKQ